MSEDTPKLKLGEQSVANVKLGGYYVFTAPEGSGGYLDRKKWYGSKQLHEFNNAFVDGQVIKINPKSVTIQKVTVGDWDYGHIYKIPKDARATVDLTDEMKKRTTTFKPLDITGSSAALKLPVVEKPTVVSVIDASEAGKELSEYGHQKTHYSVTGHKSSKRRSKSATGLGSTR